MQTRRRNSEATEAASTPAVNPSRGRRRWLAGVGALLVVGLLIASSVLVFSLVSQSNGNQANRHGPAGQWKAVQQGYLFLSIRAAASNPAVLYACATTSAAVSDQGGRGAMTVLRSGDGGNTWQNISTNLSLFNACDLAVNPANSDDVYVSSGGMSPQSPAVLHHSTDGGNTWQTIQPRVFTSATSSTQRISLQQLTIAGNSLLAINWVFTPIPPMPVPSPPRLAIALPRLVRSSDGGQSWTIIDNQFAGLQLGAQSFAVDPSNPNTIYEILGRLLLPVERSPSGGVVPTYGASQQLYKTTSGGVSWTLILDKLFYGSQVQVAANNPSIVYVGGVLGPIPVVAQGSLGAAGAPKVSTIPRVLGGFHLQVSRDGGETWHVVATPPDQAAILNWFVSADGHVIASPTIPFVVSGTATGVVVTAVSGTAVPVPPCCKGTPQQDSTSAYGSTVGNSPNTVSGGASGPTDVSPPPGKSPILNYDPASNSWSKVSAPPGPGDLLAVTTGSNGEVVLWFMGIGKTGTQYTMYRYIV